MSILLSPETQRLLEERMKRDGFGTPDEVVRFALQTLDGTEAAAIEALDPETQAALHEAEAQADRGEGRPWEDVRGELRAKYLRD